MLYRRYHRIFICEPRALISMHHSFNDARHQKRTLYGTAFLIAALPIAVAVIGNGGEGERDAADRGMLGCTFRRLLDEIEVPRIGRTHSARTDDACAALEISTAQKRWMTIIDGDLLQFLQK